ncbi:MAG: DUF2281 domain-containing protein [Deinococcus sp.]|nr:DUF2281 domain-containing protein [Deinococcus sp.]
MDTYSNQEQAILEKIRTLPPEKVAEVVDFVDFLCQQINERRLTQAAAALSARAFQAIWDNPDDADYDQL